MPLDGPFLLCSVRPLLLLSPVLPSFHFFPLPMIHVSFVAPSKLVHDFTADVCKNCPVWRPSVESAFGAERFLRDLPIRLPHTAFGTSCSSDRQYPSRKKRRATSTSARVRRPSPLRRQTRSPWFTWLHARRKGRASSRVVAVALLRADVLFVRLLTSRGASIAPQSAMIKERQLSNPVAQQADAVQIPSLRLVQPRLVAGPRRLLRPF